MGIVDEDVVAVREASDLVAIVSQYTQLRRVGRSFTGLCPFHSEKTPSFSVNGEKGYFYCFGCQAKGDAISFVREIEHLDFVGAVEWLAGRAGITLRYTERDEGEGRKRRATLIAAMERAVAWYHERLMSHADAGPARSYLRSRGFDKDMVETYRIGWAPDDWDQLATALKLPDDVLSETGLGFRNRRGRQQDAFRARVLFPIFDVSGDPVAFGGRILPGAEGAKYINSHESPIYAKSRVLYGLNWAKGDIVAADEVIVCEGYTDVIGFATAGVRRAVATCGTALTESHVQLLRKYAKRVVLAFDADAAGLAAAERFYEWEQKFEVDVAVAALPGGVDPADLARNDPEALVLSIENAKPFLGFRVDRTLAAAVLTTPEGRARAAEAALAVIAEHPSELVRDQYLMAVADRCRLDAERLREQLRSPRRPRAAAGTGPQVTERRRDTPSMEALRLAVHRPAEMVHLLDAVLFDDETQVAAFEALRATVSLREAIERSDPSAADLLQRVAVEESDADPLDVVTRLVEEETKRALSELDAEARGSQDPLAFEPTIRWLKLNLMRLRADDPEPDVVDQLVAWHRQRAVGDS